MKFNSKYAATALIAAMGLSVAACEGPAENAMEDKGEMAAEQVDVEAEALEDAGAISEETEDSMTEMAEDKADAMEETGEAMDEAAGN